jgi:uncharacterized membrane protein
MESESRSPRREKEPPQWHHAGGETIDIAYRRTDGITESLQHQLQAMHSTFLSASDSILAQISETGSQLEQLERRIDEMVKEAGSFRDSSLAHKRSQAQMASHEVIGSSQQ